MSSPILLLDCNFLCYRNFFANPDLSFEDIPTSVTYGFFRDILTFQNEHNTDRIVFCFDHGLNVRLRDYPAYKQNRQDRIQSQEDEDKRTAIRNQVRGLKKRHLPFIGFNNVHYQSGYEADDVIASICKDPELQNEEFIIISADHDLYQLLQPNVKMWHPKTNKFTTLQHFTKEWGIKPHQWVNVKAIAGCSSDNIKGVEGVGEKTAAKYLRAELKEDSVAFQKITSEEGRRLKKINRKIVKLPYPDCNWFPLRKDNINRRHWDLVLKRLGIRSLNQYPGQPRR